MDFKELQSAIEEIDGHLNAKFPIDSQREKMFARTVKLNEEVGELCNEVLAFDGDQRAEKLQHSSKETLENEFADVIITTYLLAKTMKVDMSQALERKIERVRKRFQKQA